MADIQITHTHEDGTLLTGSSKGDGVLEMVRPHGFQWRPAPGIHIPCSRDRVAKTGRINAAAQALRDAGHTVTTTIDDTWRPAAERDAARAARVADRVERLEDRADRAAAASTDRYDAQNKILDGIPFGQPVQAPGHHSRAGHLRALDRADNHMRKSIELGEAAQGLADRAAGAASNEDAKHTPGAMYRRRETLQVEARDIERKLAGHTRNFLNNAGEIYTQDVTTPATGSYADRLRLRAAMIAEEVAYLTAQLAEHDVWGPEHFVKGDRVFCAGSWYTVTRVNRKSVSLAGNMWPRTMTWDGIHGRRRDGVQHDTPNSTPWPADLAKRVSRWAKLARSAAADHGYGYGSDEARVEAGRVNAATRLVHGLPVTASAAELRAVSDSITGTDERRDLAAAYLAVFDQLAAGDQLADVAATLTPITGAPAWREPTGREPVDRRAAPGWPRGGTLGFVNPGDLIVGMHERYFGGQRIMRHFVGPVASVSAVNDRREAGEFVTITLVDGQETIVKTHHHFLVHPAGTWENADTGTAVEDECPTPAAEPFVSAWGTL